LRSFSRFPALEENELPDVLQVVTTRGKAMDKAWRRLRSSADYRPLLYAAWEQERIEYYPPIHIHDEHIVATRLRPQAASLDQDPTSEILTAINALTELRPVSSPPSTKLPVDGLWLTALPVPVRDIFYQLDGTVQLRRSRFLHLDLDLEYRFAANEYPSGSQESKVQPVVYRFKQSRQTNSGTMQYFDSPFFGALVLVSKVAAADRG